MTAGPRSEQLAKVVLMSIFPHHGVGRNSNHLYLIGLFIPGTCPAGGYVGQELAGTLRPLRGEALRAFLQVTTTMSLDVSRGVSAGAPQNTTVHLESKKCWLGH